MLDINPYILPINKESVGNITSAIAIAKEAEKIGVQKIIATPRNIQGKQDTITNLVNKINQQLFEQNSEIELIPGQTIRIYGELEKDLESNNILTYGSDPTYVFIELMNDHIPEYTKQLCYDIQLKGYQPVFIYPEKNLKIQEDYDHLYSLVKNGALVQISAKTLTGRKGKKLQKLTREFVQHNLVHFIGSDTLEAKEYYLDKAFGMIKKLHKWETIQNNMKSLIEQKAVQGEEPVRLKRSKILGIF